MISKPICAYFEIAISHIWVLNLLNSYVSFMSDVQAINVPTLLVQNSNDEYLNRQSIEEYYDALEVEKEMMWLDLGTKRAAGYDYLTQNPEKILSFFVLMLLPLMF